MEPCFRKVWGFSNTGSGTLNYSVQASTLPGASGWLNVSSNNGTVVRPFLDVSFVDVSVDARSLAQGTYYGQITVKATGASNSPQTAVVVLTVLPPGSNPGPVVRPTGLIFTGVAGAESPGSQDVTVANITANPTTFGSSIAYVGTGGSIKYHPTDFTVTPSAPARIVVQPDFTKLTSGPHRAALTLAFDDGSNPVISILAVIAPAGTSPRASPKGDRLAGSCVPSKLLPQITQVGFGPSTTVSYPAVISVKVVDDCGQPMTDGSVVASFSNGDVPLSLSQSAGRQLDQFLATRPPGLQRHHQRGRASTVAESYRQRAIRHRRAASGQPESSGFIRQSRRTGDPHRSAFAPGDLMLLKGIGLANGQASSSAAPLKLQLAGASVYIGGSSASLLYADTGAGTRIGSPGAAVEHVAAGARAAGQFLGHRGARDHRRHTPRRSNEGWQWTRPGPGLHRRQDGRRI